MIQNVISRLAGQSTSVKSWSVTVTAGILGLAATTDRAALTLVAAYTALAFAVLDAYYLVSERAYRTLYRDIVETADAPAWTLDIPRPTIGRVLEAL